MQKPFDETVRALEQATSYHEFAYVPQEAVEELAKIARNLHEALAKIAYTDNWPARVRHGEAIMPDELSQWMQSTAADTLTNYDRDTYREMVRRSDC